MDLASRAAVAVFIDQAADFLGIEQAGPAQVVFRHHSVYIVAGRRVEEDFLDGGAVRLLGPVAHDVGDLLAEALLEDVFFVKTVDFPVGRHARGKVDHPVVQERQADFEGIGHGRPVPLGGEQVIGQEELHFQVLGPGNQVAGCKIKRKTLEDLFPPWGSVELLCDLRAEELGVLAGIVPADAVRKAGVFHVTGLDGIKGIQKGARSSGILEDIGVELLEQQGADFGIGLPPPELTDFGFLEDVVAAEDLVGPLAGEHHLELVFPHQTGQEVQRNRGCAQDGFFAVPDEIGEMVANALVGCQGSPVIRLQVGDHLLLVAAFVEGTFLKADGEGLETVVEVARNEGRN